MTEREQAIANWQTKLEHAFADTCGVLGERVQQLDRSERAHGLEITQRLAGFTTLVESYQDFAIQSLEEVSQQDTTLHVMSLAYHVAALRRFRVALNAFQRGYYFDALGDLRGVYEITMYIGGVLKGFFSMNGLYPPLSESDDRNTSAAELRKRKNKHIRGVERELRERMWGSDSGLTEQQQAQIQKLLTVLHMHVHRGESNVAVFVLDAVQRGRCPAVQPRLDLEHASQFANTAAFLAWAHLRTLAYISWPVHYSTEWNNKRALLDESFRFFFDGWEKPYAKAIMQLIDTSFRFDEAQASRQVTVDGADQG